MNAASDRWLAGTVFALAFSLTLLLTGWQYPGGDGAYYSTLTKAMVLDGTFDCSKTGRPLSEGNLYLGYDGGTYTKFPVGQALIQAPIFWVMSRFFDFRSAVQVDRWAEVLSLRLTQSLLAALATTMLLRLLMSALGHSLPHALLTCALFLFCTQNLLYSKYNYSEMLQTALLVTCTFALLCLSPHLGLILFSTAFSLLVLTKPALIVLFPAFVLLIYWSRVYRQYRIPMITSAAVIAFAGAAFLAYYNYARNGSILDFGYKSQFNAKGNSFYALHDHRRFWKTLASLFFSTERNIFLYNPVIFLAVPGFFFEKHRAYRWFFALFLGIFLAIFSLEGTKWSGPFGPRYSVPLIVLTMPLVANTLRRVTCLSPRWRIPAICGTSVICALSLYVAALGGIYFQFAEKNFFIVYDNFAQERGLPKGKTDFATSTIAIYHYLLWNQEDDKRTYKEFPWLDTPAAGSTVATEVMNSPQLNRIWVRRDLMFFDPLVDRAIPPVRFVRKMLIALLLASLVVFAVVLRRRPAPSANLTAARIDPERENGQD